MKVCPRSQIRNNQVKVVPGGNRYFYHYKLRLTTITAACDSKHAMFTVCLSTPVYFRFLWSTPVHLISKLLNKFNWMPFFGFNFLILPTRKFYFRAIYNLVFRLFRQTCFCWPLTLETPNPILIRWRSIVLFCTLLNTVSLFTRF